MSLSDTRDYVLAVASDKDEASRIAKATATKLEARETTLIDVVQSLGEFINDEDEKIRARAVSYLTAVISALSPKFLTRQQIQVICQFFCDRIQDGGAIEGVSRLQSLDRFTSEMVQTVVRAMFENFGDLQTRNQGARYKVLQLLNEILSNHRKAVRDMGDESLVGITDLVAGEKDPRNLMLIFSMLRVLMVEWDITRHTEAMFDSVYAYFPITFRPPPNDPYGITAQDLKNRLRDCLSSTGALAPHAIPNLLDRLDSTSNTVKRDVLQALTACANNYDVATLGQYSVTLWDAVKFEVLQAQEPELADEALLVLEGIASTLSKAHNNSAQGSPLLQYLKPINKECLEHLQEPGSRQAKAAGDILKAVSSASLASFEIVIKAVGPALLTIHQSADTILKQRSVLEVTNQLFEAAIEVYGSWTSLSSKNPTGKDNLLNEFKDKFIAIYSQALMGTVKEEVSFRLTAANGLLLVSRMRSLLQDTEIGLFVQYFDDIVLKEESYSRDELKRKAMTALAEISKFKPRLISDITFPAFMARLPDTEEEAENSDHQSVLEGLAEISIEKDLLETLMRRLLNKLDLLLRTEGSGPFPYTCAILGCIYYVLDRAVSSQNITLDPYYDRIVVGLVRKSTGTETGSLTDEIILSLIGRVTNLIVRKSSQENISRTANNIYVLFRDLEPPAGHINLSALFHPPTISLVSTWLLASIPKDNQNSNFQKDPIITNIQDLVSFAQTTKNTAIEHSCFRQIALYVNKHLSNSDLGIIDNILIEQLNSLQHEPSHEQRDAGFTIRLCLVLIKALSLRLAPKTSEHLAKLVDLLDNSKYPSDISKTTAAGFSMILAPDDILSKQNGAQIRLLAPQRIFQILTPLISTKFRASESDTEKENCLIALSGILGTVPSEIVMPELPTLLPLLLQSLDISDQSVKVATLETLAVVIANNPSALEESGHIAALVKRLLQTAALPKPQQKKPASPSLPRSRRLATRCLTLMPKHITGGGSRANPLLSLKKEVLQGLVAVLDDPRRDVRKEAVDARGAWIRSVDDPDEDEDED